MICSQLYNQASSIISITMRFYVLSIILVFLLVGGLLGKGLQVDAASVTSAKFDGPSNHLRGQLRRYMPPLEHDPQDRWPILYWGAAPQDHLLVGDMIRRGIAPLCISTSLHTPTGFQAVRPFLKTLVVQGKPVVMLPQGLVQRAFVKDIGGCPHQLPARQEADNKLFSCPAWMYESPEVGRQAVKAQQIALNLQRHGVVPASIWIDFESGAYLRNGNDKEKKVRLAMNEALKCPRCLARFGELNLNSPQKYQRVVDQARSHVIRRAFSEPVRSVFPECRIGNFYTHPILRQPRQAGLYPAYGWEGSLLDVAQPRCYMTPGWGGGGRDQGRVNWNIFLYCVRQFSNCAKVLREDEMLVPWIGYLFHYGPAKRGAQWGFKIASSGAYREMVIHTMMRGAETIAVFAPGSLAQRDFPDVYPPDFARRDMGPFLLNMLDVQQAYDRMLAYHDILRHGQVLNYEIGGRYNALDQHTAVWSGVGLNDRALIRTVSFGSDTTRTISLFGNQVELPFKRTGQFFWVDQEGMVQAAGPLD